MTTICEIHKIHKCFSSNEWERKREGDREAAVPKQIEMSVVSNNDDGCYGYKKHLKPFPFSG